jgi:hypothetical protein
MIKKKKETKLKEVDQVVPIVKLIKIKGLLNFKIIKIRIVIQIIIKKINHKNISIKILEMRQIKLPLKR